MNKGQKNKKSDDKPPILLIHPVGIGLSGWFWEKVIKSMSNNHDYISDIYCPDLIGNGKVGDIWIPSERGLFFPLDWARQCETLLHDVMDCQSCIVVVQGGLAPVGVLLAHRNPSIVKSLILCSPPTWDEMTRSIPDDELQRNFDFLTSNFGAAAFSLLETRWAVRFFSNLFLFKDEADGKWLENVMNDCIVGNRSVIAAFNSGLCIHRSFEDELMELETPTLIISGNSDRRQDRRKDYFMKMKRCQEIILDGCNVLPWESSEAVVESIFTFIKDKFR